MKYNYHYIDFEDFLPTLLGTAEQIQQASSIRRKQAYDLLVLRSSIDPQSVLATFACALIDAILARNQASEWINTGAIQYNREWIKAQFEATFK